MINFFYLNGYGYYVWPAYSIVIAYLFFQWLMPWKKLKNAMHQCINKQDKNE